MPKSAESIAEISPVEIKKVIHELHVQQVELETQNEQLRQAQIEATQAREKYADRYDFAPVGYFTFDRKGNIIEVNVTGASLLGSEKRSLTGQPFHRFITPGHLRIFQSHLQQAHELRSKQTCKLKLTRKDAGQFDVLIDTIVVMDGEGKVDHYRSSVTDITEITRAEAEAARLATFPQLNPNPIAEVDFAGQIHYLNPAAERLFPNLRQRGTEHPWLVDWESLVRKLREDATRVIIREVRVGGRWCQQTLQLVEETQRIRIYGIDITERELAEDALRRSEARYRNLFLDSSAPMLLIDPATAEIVDANPAACRYYGYTHTELKTKKITDINILTSKQIFEEMKRAKTRERRSFEFSHRLASGEIHPVEVFSGPIDLEGRVLLLSIVHDITDRKQAEIELQKVKDDLEERVQERTAELKSASLYARSLIEASLDPLVTINRDGKITDVNESTEVVTGRTKNELIGTDFSDYFTEPERARAGYEQVFKEGFVKDYPLAIRHSTGRLTEVLYNASIYKDESGAVKGVFAAARDVTELHRIQEALRKSYDELELRVKARTADLKERTEQLEAANKELESFSYSVSHDLRAPLRAIDGYARLILKKQGDKFDQDTLDKFNTIRSSTHLMGQLIDDLLILSRVGKKHMSMSELNMDHIIQEVWKELQIINPERDMTLTIHSMPPGYADRTLIKQVYSNLLGNAVKFTKNRDAAHIEAGGCTENGEDIFYVKDNGVGFDMTYYDKLFGIFQRLHSIDDFEGTGVGLAIIQRIIHRHGGRVWAEGKVGEGAVFYFSLPENRESYSHI